MPRKPRFYLPGVPAHIVQRGRSREPVFFEIENYLAYLGWLHEASERYACNIHAYVLMTNHIHILVTPEEKNSISLMMQYIGRQYVPYINHAYGSSGSIWEGRYKSNHCCPVNKMKLSKQADVAVMDKGCTIPRHETDTSTIDTP